MTSKPLAAVVVGLGKVGSRFDEEQGRGSVWTHAGAYLARPDLFKLIGACEPDRGNAEAFRSRCPNVPVFSGISEMLAHARPDVASICTPAESHASVLNNLLPGESVRAIWCEKPLATKIEDSIAMTQACAARGVPLVVSYTRRWLPIWQRARELVRDGTIGPLRAVRIALPNRLWSMGSHAVDLVQFLGGEITEVVTMTLPGLEQENEPAVAAMFRLKEGAYGIFQVTGWKANYLVEGEAIGDDGRIVIREDTGTIVVERFAPSGRYAGYREPDSGTIERIDTPSDFSPFVAIAEEIAGLLSGARDCATCDGTAALAVQKVLAQMASAA